MGLDMRIMSASVDADQYRELAQAFPDNADRDLIAKAVSEPIPSPLSFAIMAAKRKAAEILQKRTVTNG